MSVSEQEKFSYLRLDMGMYNSPYFIIQLFVWYLYKIPHSIWGYTTMALHLNILLWFWVLNTKHIAMCVALHSTALSSMLLWRETMPAVFCPDWEYSNSNQKRVLWRGYAMISLPFWVLVCLINWDCVWVCVHLSIDTYYLCYFYI